MPKPKATVAGPREARHAAWLVLLFGLVIGLAFQGSRHLYDPDEGRYTDVAHEMVDLEDWLVPRLDPERPHFTKPPLTYWAIGASFNLLGSSEWAARVPNAIAFALTGVLVFGIARLLGLPNPVLAAGIWLTMWGPVLAANIVTTDTLLVWCETLAVFGFAASGLVMQDATPRRVVAQPGEASLPAARRPALPRAVARPATGNLHPCAVAAAVAIALKGAGALLHTEDDAHRLAGELRRAADLATVDEVAFVDIPARYGLRHYLQLNVEQIESHRGALGQGGYSAPEPLCDELRMPERILLIAPLRKMDALAPRFAACGHHLDRVGTLRNWALFRSVPDPAASP